MDNVDNTQTKLKEGAIDVNIIWRIPINIKDEIDSCLWIINNESSLNKANFVSKITSVIFATKTKTILIAQVKRQNLIT